MSTQAGDEFGCTAVTGLSSLPECLMNFELGDVLKLIGPAASIVFAAWIFMGFLQQRYDSAVDRYRSMIAESREPQGLSDVRRSNIRDELVTYQRRCRVMMLACDVGLVSAVLLITTLIAGELDIIFTGVALFKYASAISAAIGLGLVIVAAGLVFFESSLSRRQLQKEGLDVPDVAEALRSNVRRPERRFHLLR